MDSGYMEVVWTGLHSSIGLGRSQLQPSFFILLTLKMVLSSITLKLGCMKQYELLWFHMCFTLQIRALNVFN